MAIEKMLLVNIFGARNQLDKVILKCSDFKNFHPEQSSAHSEKVTRFSPLVEENPYASLLKKISDLGVSSQIDLASSSATAESKVKFTPKNHRQSNININSFADEENPNLKELLSCKYLEVRFGRIPLANIKELSGYSENLFYYVSLSSDAKYSWGLYITTELASAEVDDIFDSLAFERIYIPEVEEMTVSDILNDQAMLDGLIEKYSAEIGFNTGQENINSQKVKGFAPINEENPYASLLKKFRDLGAATGIAFDTIEPDSESLPTDAIDEMIEEFQDKLQSLYNTKLTIENAAKSFESALTHINHLDKLDYDLDELFNSKFLKVRFGRMPDDSYKKLSYYKDKMFFYIKLDKENGQTWGIYISSEDFAAEVDEIFSSLYFERVWLPEYVRGTPGSASAHLKSELEAQYEAMADIDSSINGLTSANEGRFRQIYARLKFLSESFDMRKFVSVHDETFHIEGFIPEKQVKIFADIMEEIDDISVKISPADTDRRLTPPTKLKNNFIFRPFEMFVEMYGLPGYHDMDPTPFVAITFMLLFGVMFGDAGQGLAIMIVGFLLSKIKKVQLGDVMVRIGFSSALFGVFYGSVFGFEELLNPFFINVLGLTEKPIDVMAPSSTNLVLGTAIALGVILLICTMVLNIALSLRKKDYSRAFLSSSGAAGITFYIGVVLLAVNKIMFSGKGFNDSFITPILAICFLLMFFKEPLTHRMEGHKTNPFKDGLGAFITESFFEMFEILLSFITNTMSFLRVGGFALAHAGMMAVVFTLAATVPPAFAPLVIVIGNIFVMGFEGLIVGIQVLRLEFYELFSHYFDGTGKPFTPIGTTVE